MTDNDFMEQLLLYFAARGSFLRDWGVALDLPKSVRCACAYRVPSNDLTLKTSEDERVPSLWLSETPDDTDGLNIRFIPLKKATSTCSFACDRFASVGDILRLHQ